MLCASALNICSAKRCALYKNHLLLIVIIPPQQGIFTSADVEFDLCDEQGHCEIAGTFAILGGPLEMPWQFDRLFKYDVTAVFSKMHLRPESDYHFRVRIKAVNGTDLDPHLLEAPSVSFEPGRRGYTFIKLLL